MRCTTSVLNNGLKNSLIFNNHCVQSDVLVSSRGKHFIPHKVRQIIKARGGFLNSGQGNHGVEYVQN